MPVLLTNCPSTNLIQGEMIVLTPLPLRGLATSTCSQLGNAGPAASLPPYPCASDLHQPANIGRAGDDRSLQERRSNDCDDSAPTSLPQTSHSRNPAQPTLLPILLSFYPHCPPPLHPTSALTTHQPFALPTTPHPAQQLRPSTSPTTQHISLHPAHHRTSCPTAYTSPTQHSLICQVSLQCRLQQGVPQFFFLHLRHEVRHVPEYDARACTRPSSSKGTAPSQACVMA